MGASDVQALSPAYPIQLYGDPAEARSFPTKSLGGELERRNRERRLGSRIEALLGQADGRLAVGTRVQAFCA